MADYLTTARGIKSPAGTNPANGAVDLKVMADSIDASMRAIGSFQAYPGYWYSGTNLAVMSVGDGSAMYRYARIGSLIVATMQIIRGATTNLGAGEYSWRLPVPMASYLRGYGGGVVKLKPVQAYFPDANRFVLTDSAGNRIGLANPGGWASGDKLAATVIYEAES